MKTPICARALIVVLIVCTPAFAVLADTSGVESNITPGAETHDGFFLRLAAGPSGIGAGLKLDSGMEMAAGGEGSQIEISVGGALTNHLILHADLVAAGSGHLEGEVDGSKYDFDDNGLGLVGVGFGLTYFVMPLNLSISASVLAVQAGFINPRDDEAEEMPEEVIGTRGAGMAKLTVTKEWWVSSNWALGVGGTVYGGGGRVETDKGEEGEMGFGGASMMFSATFN